MEVPVVMPPLGDAAGELLLGRWHKIVGADVVKGEPLFEVETDKVDVTVEALASGVLSRIELAKGEAAEIGQTIAFLEVEE